MTVLARQPGARATEDLVAHASGARCELLIGDFRAGHHSGNRRLATGHSRTHDRCESCSSADDRADDRPNPRASSLRLSPEIAQPPSHTAQKSPAPIRCSIDGIVFGVQISDQKKRDAPRIRACSFATRQNTPSSHVGTLHDIFSLKFGVGVTVSPMTKIELAAPVAAHALAADGFAAASRACACPLPRAYQ